MQLRAMRFARIDGTEVLVEVKSETEAKAAIKELRHKKKEIALLKRRISKQETRARRTVERAEEAAEREARRRGLLATMRRISRAFTKKSPLPDLHAIRQDLEKPEEPLQNTDGSLAQREGRLPGGARLPPPKTPPPPQKHRAQE